MGKFCAEEITMGFMFSKPVSKFYGHFDDAESAEKWCDNKFFNYEKIKEGELPFYQKDMGSSAIEVYIQDCEDEDFMRYSSYKNSVVIPIK